MSAVETLGAKPASQNYDDCACPRPTTATLASTEGMPVLDDCACPQPATASLERGAGVDVMQQNNCACPDVVTPVVTEVTTLQAVDLLAIARPETVPSIKINVVVPQA